MMEAVHISETSVCFSTWNWAGVCSKFVDKGLAPAKCTIFFLFVLAFGSWDGQDNIDICI
jgi:hypothetical protein